MAKVIILHASYTNAESEWYPWLREELQKLGHEVFTPNLPTPEEQSLSRWMDAFEPYWQHVGPETIFIGHSVGAVFVLRLIEKATEPIAGTILLAPFVSPVSHQGINLVTATFVNDDLSWKQIHDKAGNVLVFHGQDDPYIDYEESKEVANLLGVEMNELEGAGHFDTASGVVVTPFLIEAVDYVINPKMSDTEEAVDVLNKEFDTAGIDVEWEARWTSQHTIMIL